MIKWMAVFFLACTGVLAADDMTVKVEPVRPAQKTALFNGDTIDVWVNGVMQNQGTGAYARSGQICLQSEGGPIEFRNVTVEPLH